MDTKITLILLTALLTCVPALDTTAAIEEFYSMCKNEGSLCAGGYEYVNMSCFDSHDCYKAFGVTKGLTYHMFSQGEENVTYVSFGFSKDENMGDDQLVTCIKNGDEMNFELAVTDKHKYQKMETKEGLIKEEGTMEVEDQTIYCKFSLVNALQFARNTTNDTEFFILGVSGSFADDGASVGYHSPGWIISEKKWAIPDTSFSSFYDVCGQEGVKCAGAAVQSEEEDGSCLTDRNCTRAVAMEKNETQITFHVLGNSGVQYVSVGFSNDTKMGAEAVVSCVKQNDGNVVGEYSFDNGHKNELRDLTEDLHLLEYSVTDGSIYCKFTVDNPLAYARQSNVTDEEFYILAVAGEVNEDGKKKYHGDSHIITAEKWALTYESSATQVFASTLLMVAVTLLTQA